MAADADIDIVIAGGGPAGTAAALTLATHTSHRVLVLESSHYDGARVGETVSPGIRPLLDYLGVTPRFLADAHAPGLGTAAAWGGPVPVARDYLFTGRGDGWHLDRERFDRSMADAAVERGARLRTGARVVSVSGTGPYRIAIATDAAGHDVVEHITARFLIDATGRSASLARVLGARREPVDRMIGIVGFHTLDRPRSIERNALIEAVPDGWWYSAPLPNGRIVAAFMTDADIARRERLADPGVWVERLRATDCTAARINGGVMEPELRIRSAASHLLDPVGAPGWVAAGDAACSFDPLAAMGIGHAISSGIHAARAAHNFLNSSGTILDEYISHVAANFRRYLELRTGYYAVERRWEENTFWKRRRALPRE
ncbi:MAG: FAD-dependent oxidoreductase [Bacteroidota bacterium]